MADFEDSSVGHTEVHTPTVTGVATIDNDTYKYGGGCGRFGNSGIIGIVIYGDSDDWDFGDGEVTISCWVYKEAGNEFHFTLQQTLSGNDMWQCRFHHDTIQLYSYIGGSLKVRLVKTVSSELSVGWHHIEISKGVSSGYVFIDGVKQTLDVNTYNKSFPSTTAQLKLQYHLSSLSDGYIDVLKIDKGICRHTEDFTPPANEDVDNDEYTVLLLKMNPPPPFSINIGDAWKEGVPYINIGDEWKEVTSLKINIGGVWKDVPLV